MKSIRSIFYLTLAGVAFLSLIPASGSSGFQHMDKVYHFIAYFVLAFLGYSGFALQRKPLKAALLLGLTLAGFGLLIEFLQQFSGRDTSLLDAVANTTGVILGIPAARLFIWSLEKSE